LQRLGDAERLVLTRYCPIYLQAGHVRVTGLIEEQSPITFAWSDSSQQPTLITSSAAEAAGIQAPDGAASETISLSAGRSVEARRIVVPYIRLGACVLRDVSALLLPPEAEDWGNRIGRDALGDHSVKLEPERLRLWIDGP
jgi:hypothetical protein